MAEVAKPPYLSNVSFSRVRAWLSGQSPLEPVQNGETGYEIDTGKYYVYFNGDWYTYPTELVTLSLMDEKLEAIRALLAGGLKIDQTDVLEVLDDLNAKAPNAKATPATHIPGIGAAVAYALRDTFGGAFEIPMPAHGKLFGARFFDPDYEGIGKTVLVFSRAFTPGTDNSAISISDNDQRNIIAEIDIPSASFVDLGASMAATGLLAAPVSFSTPDRRVFVQCYTHGADNIAADARPAVSLLYE